MDPRIASQGISSYICKSSAGSHPFHIPIPIRIHHQALPGSYTLTLTTLRAHLYLASSDPRQSHQPEQGRRLCSYCCRVAPIALLSIVALVEVALDKQNHHCAHLHTHIYSFSTPSRVFFYFLNFLTLTLIRIPKTFLSTHRIYLLLYIIATETYSSTSPARCPTSLARRYPRARIALCRSATKQTSV
jgi:hypothetical protein